MYGGLARGMGAYQQEASSISSKAAAYRADVDHIKTSNKALVKAAESATDLTALRDLGTEGAIRMLKPKLVKGLSFAYKKTGLKDWDIKTTKKIQDWRERMGMKERTNQARPGESNETDGQPSTSSESPEVGESGEGGGSGDFTTEGDGPSFQELPSEADERDMMGGEDRDVGQGNRGREMGDREEKTSDDIEESKEDDELDFGDDADIGGREGAKTGIESEQAELYDEQGLWPKGSKPLTGEDLTRIDDRARMVREDFDAPESGARGGGELDGNTAREGSPTEPGEEVTGNGDTGPTDLARRPGTGGEEGAGAEEGAGEDLAETAGTDLAEAGAGEAAEGVAGGLEAAGAAADATGVGAIVGVPMQILGGLAELFGLYETGKGVGEWFDQDVLGHHPKVATTAIPKAPTVNRANMALPSFDSVQDAPTTAGGW